MAHLSGAVDGNHFGPYASVNTGTIYSNHPPPPVPPAICYLPYEQNRNFVQRPDITLKLDEILAQNHRHAALWGLGGEGKTQFALDFAHRKYKRDGHDACAVFWVNASSETTFARDFEVIASKLNIDTRLKGKDLYRSVCNKIEEQHSWVMVIDNADDLTIFGQRPAAGGGRAPETTKLNLKDFVPKGSNGTVLWTSRDAHISEIVGPEQAIKVGRMTLDDATLLLARNLRVAPGRGNTAMPEDADTAAGQQLLEELEFLPLAISQAAAYIRNTRIDISTYLHFIQDNATRWSVLADCQDDQHRPSATSNSVFRSLDTTATHFQKKDPMAYRLLSVIAFVHAQNIPLELLEKVVATSNSELAASAVTVNTTRAIARLQDFSLLEEVRAPNGETRYEIHQLTQEGIRFHLQMRKFFDGDPLTPMIASSSMCEPKFNHTSRLGNPRKYENFEQIFALEAYLILLAIIRPFKLDEVHHEPWGLCRTLIAHAMIITDNADACCTRRTSSYTHVHLLELVFPWLDRLGMWQEGQRVAERLLSHARREYGLKDLATLRSMALLADVYIRQDRLDEAERQTRTCLALCVEMHLENSDRTFLFIRHQLASLLYSQGNLEEACELFKAVLAHRPDLGRFDDGFELAQNSLFAEERVLGSESKREKGAWSVLDGWNKRRSNAHWGFWEKILILLGLVALTFLAVGITVMRSFIL